MFTIGSPHWVSDLQQMTEHLGSDFWSDFRPASMSQMQDVENTLGRELDPEFLEFYCTIGYGPFPRRCGGFHSPEDLVLGAGPSIYFITGGLSPGQEWASAEEHARLWLTRGQENPDPKRFTEEALTLDGVKLYDLLQFGSNGCCCYHQLYVGPVPAMLRYCLLTDSGEMEDRSLTFSEAIQKIIGHYQQRFRVG